MTDLKVEILCRDLPEVKAVIERLKGMLEIQTNFFRAAMDRAEAAEAELVAHQELWKKTAAARNEVPRLRERVAALEGAVKWAEGRLLLIHDPFGRNELKFRARMSAREIAVPTKFALYDGEDGPCTTT
jgi:hypothetical protein